MRRALDEHANDVDEATWSAFAPRLSFVTSSADDGGELAAAVGTAEAAQDILALRFANGLFEPIWNRRHVASVQIDIPEDLGLEGRGSFYEETGAFRDMVVTHLSQIVGFVAMEPPRSLDATALRDAKAAVFADLRPFDPEHSVFGQFESYRDEDGVPADSMTETFAALRVGVDNDRWRGVPFLLRTGKALAEGGDW